MKAVCAVLYTMLNSALETFHIGNYEHLGFGEKEIQCTWVKVYIITF